MVAEFVDEHPDEVKQMEAFHSSAKWKLLGDHSGDGHFHHDGRDPSSPRRVLHDTPDPSPPPRARHDTPDPSPPRRARLSPPQRSPHSGKKTVFRDKSGQKRNLKLERLEQRRKAEDSERDELYARGAKGLLRASNSSRM